ncbi:MAG: hypothetical protein LQ343_005876 [Gyalolechia ehrenbergii]|nr:MAG: hypothetical protein LQ343_005876 [Gyalolechia ehrenbergii]
MFAILIKNGEEDLITEFRKHEVLDAQLPLSQAKAEQIAGDFGIAFAQDYQRQFLPYKFPRDMRAYYRDINHNERILPFVGKPEHVASGGFGDISRVMIFNSQQEFVQDKSGPIQVVRKEIRQEKGQTKEAYDEAFRNERNCLLLLERLEHPNIVRLLGSYTYGGRHNFLFPSYETDLWAFLQSKSRLGDFSQDSTFFSALRGLASALCHTHKLHLEKEKHGLDIDAIGYHHDLRPSNVLVSQDTFVLADFGLGKFKSSVASSKTQWQIGEGDYLAPERMDKHFVHQNVGRAFDVWAFGCLMIEVIIYMEKGEAGLNEFRQQRMSPTQSNNWEDSCFYEIGGSLKSIVRQWLKKLTHGLLRPGPVKMLADVSRKALKSKPEDRPKIEHIRAELTLISLKAHFIPVCDLFRRYFAKHTARGMGQPPNKMRLWFESERLAAFGYVTGLDSDEMISRSFSNLSGRYHEYLKALKTMAVLFEELETKKPTLTPDAIQGTDGSTATSYDPFGEPLENDICGQVESLWNLLPTSEQRKAEAAWLRTMLDTEDVRHLDDVERAFRSEDDPVFEKGAAMAMMKKIGLNMRSNPTTMPEGFIVSENDVRRRLLELRYHEFGHFKGEHVLIEWMNYSPGWEDVSPEQRAIMMSLKAQGSSQKTEPARMRTLECIGVFENTGDKAGYGFLYRIPTSDRELSIEPSTATLLQLIENKKRQPLLSDKLRLASALAQFLGDFHSAGWLHKGLNSNNILFFNIQDGEQSSSPILATQVLERPYVVGLQESRLGGKFWHTAGPASSADFQDYQHPEYARTGRYRATYDYYGLGLILLELGFWQPLRGWSRSQRYSRMSLEEFRQELITRHVPFLGAGVGAVYRNVVLYCLRETRDSSEDLDTKILEEFAKNVIEPLKELAEMNI